MTQNQPLFIPGPAGPLEALLTVVDERATQAAVICHPHPLHHGTMHNKVVTTLAKTMSELGINSVRFNYRGVGQSEGAYDHAVGEVDDCLAVLQWLQSQYSSLQHYWLAGFSFGAYIAAKACETWPTQQLISIAPAVNHANYASLHVQCPWLVVGAEQDEIVPITEIRAWVKNPPAPLQYIEIASASHFFHGKLIELRDQLLQRLSA